MTQFSKGETFADGQQVTAARLNQLVDASTLLVGAITEQPSIAANTLQSTDSTIVNDGGVLKEATIGDILNSNLPITPSSINNANELLITSTDGTAVSGVSYSAIRQGTDSSLGTITITSIAHGLTTNNFVNITTATGDWAAATNYGVYRVATVSTNSFTITTQNKFVPSTYSFNAVADTGTLTYVREGTVRTTADSFFQNPAFFNSSVLFSSSSTLNIRGTATAVTQSLNDNSTKLATTAYVDTSQKVFANVLFDGVGKTGTWSQSGTTVTVNITNHNAVIGEPVHFIATSGTFASGSGAYVVVTRPTLNQYTFTVSDSNTASGNCTQSVAVRRSLGIRLTGSSTNIGVTAVSGQTGQYLININNISISDYACISTPNSAVLNRANTGVTVAFYSPAGVAQTSADCNVILVR